VASFLTVVLDWATRHVLACGWRIASAPMSAVAALEEAIAKYGAPETMNTDGGSQFTSGDFIGVVQRHAIVIDVLFHALRRAFAFDTPRGQSRSINTRKPSAAALVRRLAW
jgi:hypothetical protein